MTSMEWRWGDNMRWIREMVKTSWDWNSMLLKDLHNNTTLGFT